MDQPGPKKPKAFTFDAAVPPKPPPPPPPPPAHALKAAPAKSAPPPQPVQQAQQAPAPKPVDPRAWKGRQNYSVEEEKLFASMPFEQLPPEIQQRIQAARAEYDRLYGEFKLKERQHALLMLVFGALLGAGLGAVFTSAKGPMLGLEAALGGFAGLLILWLEGGTLLGMMIFGAACIAAPMLGVGAKMMAETDVNFFGWIIFIVVGAGFGWKNQEHRESGKKYAPFINLAGLKKSRDLLLSDEEGPLPVQTQEAPLYSALTDTVEAGQPQNHIQAALVKQEERRRQALEAAQNREFLEREKERLQLGERLAGLAAAMLTLAGQPKLAPLAVLACGALGLFLARLLLTRPRNALVHGMALYGLAFGVALGLGRITGLFTAPDEFMLMGWLLYVLLGGGLVFWARLYRKTARSLAIRLNEDEEAALMRDGDRARADASNKMSGK